MQWKKWLPDGVILLLFLAVILVFFSPLFSGQKLIQSDILQFKGMAAEVIDYQEKNNENIHWTNAMFGGMPTYLISFKGFHNSNIGLAVNRLIRTVFPDPAGILFICLISFYILGRAFSINKWLSAIGAVFYALATFVLLSLEAGHTSKIVAFGWAPLALAGLVWLFNGKKWLGLALFALGLTLHLSVFHPQITYYIFLICLFYVLYEVVRYVKEGKALKLIQPALFALAGLVLVFGINYAKLRTTYEFSRQTIRGGKSELQTIKTTGDEVEKIGERTGLDYEYATQWSYEPLETFTLLIPNFYGGSSNEDIAEMSNMLTDSRISKRALRGGLPTYWGTMPFTSGPIYLGAVVLFLFFLGMICWKSSIKWWLLAAMLLLIFLSWGKHFPLIFDTFFNYAPFFNKFRTPSMALLLVGLIVVLIAMAGLHQLITSDERAKYIRLIYITAGSLIPLTFLVGILASGGYSFSGSVDENLVNSGWDNNLLDLLKADRAMLMRRDALRTMLFVGFTAATVYLYLKKIYKRSVFLVVIALLGFIDLTFVAKRYLKADDFESKRKYEKRLKTTRIDEAIKADEAIHYRVFNTASSSFNEATTSLHHKSVGGYHPAKLLVYQDVIERLLSTGNENAFNMLNTKYLIGQRQDGKLGIQKLDKALGNAWFVDSLLFVPTAEAEMLAVGHFNPQSQAVIQTDSPFLMRALYSSGNEIVLTNYHPDEMIYEADVTSDTEQFAVFSEVYYSPKNADGWQAYIDDEPVNHFRVNYVLRGLKIPPGKHNVTFRFEAKRYQKQATVSFIFSILLALLVLKVLMDSVFRHRK